jgi:pectin methylesterase-like acyl-CoA thioesterase
LRTGLRDSWRHLFRPCIERVEARILLTTYTVGSSGQEYTSITAAVAVANANPNPSNEILVSPGTYHESNISITSPLTLISVAGAASTIIDGGQASTAQDGIIEVSGNSSTVTIGGLGQGFTFQNAPTNVNSGDINLIDISGINAPVIVQNNVFISTVSITRSIPEFSPKARR